MLVNQNGVAVFREPIMFQDQLSDEEAKELLLTLIARLGLCAVRTNATKHGDTQILLEPTDEPHPEGLASMKQYTLSWWLKSPDTGEWERHTKTYWAPSDLVAIEKVALPVGASRPQLEARVPAAPFSPDKRVKKKTNAWKPERYSGRPR